MTPGEIMRPSSRNNLLVLLAEAGDAEIDLFAALQELRRFHARADARAACR